MHDEPTPGHEPATGPDAPAGSPAPPRRRLPRRAAAVAAGVVAGGVLVAAVAVAVGGKEATAGAAGAGSPGSGTETGGHGPGPGHRHQSLAPYDQRYSEATADEQEAADQLLASVRSTLAAYADVDDAVAAGYQAPRRPRGPTRHYLDRTVAEEGRVLDPARPDGLVYGTGAAGEPVLLGAFFVARPGAPAPSPAGELVVWHSHDPSCPAFFATADAPCADARRMLHVWTADRVELAGRDRGPHVVAVVDPFGTPFRAAITRAT